VASVERRQGVEEPHRLLAVDRERAQQAAIETFRQEPGAFHGQADPSESPRALNL
jgi:hypothetical protein